MQSFSYHQVFNQLDDALQKEITDFWFAEGAINDKELAKARLPQVLFIAREENNKIAAVTSVFTRVNEQLQCELHYMRAFIPQRFFDSEIAEQLLIHVRDLLESEYQAGNLGSSKGLMVELPGEALHRQRPQAIWPESQMVYIGKSPEGAHQRIYYFKDAEIA